MKQTELAAAAALVETLPAPAGVREPKPLKIKERFDRWRFPARPMPGSRSGWRIRS